MKYYSFHTHTHYCDGKGTPREYVLRAMELGLEAIGFSAHTPLPFDNKWSMLLSRYDDYCSEIRALKEEFASTISIYLALEMDFIPGRCYPFQQMIQRGGLDYTIGSVHLVSAPGREGLWFLDGPPSNYDKGLDELFDGDIKSAVTAYFHTLQSMMETQKPDVIGHMDKVRMNNKGKYFSPEDKWYQDLICHTLDMVKQTGTIVEVNTRGIYKKKSEDLFPNEDVLKQCYQRDIPVTISTDAHHPDELLGCFDDTRQVLKSVGYNKVMVFTGKEWDSVPL